MNRYCFACDLKDDPELIKKYRHFHQEDIVWPEITQSIRDSGIVSMEIYISGNRLFMIMNTDDTFTFKRKSEMDDQNAKVQEWEKLMWRFQQAVPWAEKGEKWVLMERMFSLS